MVRYEFKILQNRIENEPRRFVQVIYGPRQTGKTTLVNQYLASTSKPYFFASADSIPESDYTWIGLQWEMARALHYVHETESILVLDEIQKISNWSEQVKKYWDEDTLKKRQIKVILLGSSRLLLQKGLTESLAGRFETIYVGHWTYTEMNENFGFTPEQYAWYGGYPGSADLIQDEDRWKQYVRNALIETSISVDILQLTRVDKPALLKRLFELGCGYSGQILSYSKMIGQLQDAGNTTTIAHYLHLLDTAGLLTGLEKYDRQKLRQRASSPKFQVHNNALISALHPESFSTIRNEPALWGRWIESCIGTHLLNASIKHSFGLHYWRHVNDEIDFVLTKGKRAIGIEVKNVSKHSQSGMEAFIKNQKPEKTILVGSSGIPWQDFIQMDIDKLFN